MGKSIASRQMQIQAFSILSLFYLQLFLTQWFFGKKKNTLMMFENCPSYYKTPFLDSINPNYVWYVIYFIQLSPKYICPLRWAVILSYNCLMNVSYSLTFMNISFPLLVCLFVTLIQKQSAEVSYKKLFIKISQYPQKSTCAGVSFW